jgi:hypothetical protein
LPILAIFVPGREPELTYDQEVQDLWEDYGLEEDRPFFPLTGSTINELFESIRAHAVDYLQEGYIVKIWYNQEYHYPEAYFTSMGDDMIGGHFEFTITHFEVLENNGEE